jgi:hypothetical protein
MRTTTAAQTTPTATIVMIEFPGSSPTRTPVPTLTTPERAELLAYALNIIETAFGLEHPIFRDIVEQYDDSILQSIRRRGEEDKRIFVYETQFDDNIYRVGSITSPSPYPPRVFLFFRIDAAGNAQQLSVTLDFPPGYVPWDLDMFYSSVAVNAGFGDRNGNGRPDIPVWGNTGGNCCPRALLLLELNDQGEFVDITPIMTDVDPVGFEDLDEDGIWEIVGVMGSGPNFRETHLTRVYAWDGSAYIEASLQFEDWYLERIKGALVRVNRAQSCVYVPFLISSGDSDGTNIYQALLDYYVIGRIEEGWQVIRNMIHWADCKQEYTDKASRIEIWRFEQWVRGLYHAEQDDN